MSYNLSAKSPTSIEVKFPTMQGITRFEAYDGWRWRFENNVAIHEIDPDYMPLKFWKEPLPCP